MPCAPVLSAVARVACALCFNLLLLLHVGAETSEKEGKYHLSTSQELSQQAVRGWPPAARRMLAATGLPPNLRALARDAPQPMERVCLVGIPVKRTAKLLLALARGDWCLSADWLTAPLPDRLDLERYEVSDHIPGCRAARTGGGGLALKGVQVMAHGPTTMPQDELMRILVAAGATIVADNGAGLEGVSSLAYRRPGESQWSACVETDLYDAIMCCDAGRLLSSTTTATRSPLGRPGEVVAVPRAPTPPAAATSGTLSMGTGRAHCAEYDHLCAAAAAAQGDMMEACAVSSAAAAAEALVVSTPMAAAPVISAPVPDSQAMPVPVSSTGGIPVPAPREPENALENGCEFTDGSSAAARSKRPRRSSRGASSTSAGAASASHSSAIDFGGARMHFELLPPPQASSGGWFASEEALKLYRQRLPDCNVWLKLEPSAAPRGAPPAGPVSGRALPPSTDGDSRSTSRRRATAAISSSREGGARSAARGGGSRGAEHDFLRGLLEAEGARTAVLRHGEGEGGEGDARALLAACTFVPHRAARLCELQLLAVSARHAKRGLGSALLAAVEGWLADALGVHCVVALAGMDTVGFWRKRGYAEDAVTLEPEAWALLRDPFGHSQMMARWLPSGEGGTS